MSSTTVAGNSSDSSHDKDSQADLVGGPFAVIESDPGQCAQEYRRHRDQINNEWLDKAYLQPSSARLELLAFKSKKFTILNLGLWTN